MTRKYLSIGLSSSLTQPLSTCWEISTTVDLVLLTLDDHSQSSWAMVSGSLKISSSAASSFSACKKSSQIEEEKFVKIMQHLCSPHKWPMEIGHHKWPLKAIVVPNAKHEGYNEALGGHEWWPIHWSRVRTTQIPLFSLLTTSKSPHLP